MQTTTLSLPTLDLLRRHVHQTLCDHDHLDPAQSPLKQTPVVRSGRVCGAFFQVNGPRQTRVYAVWAGDEKRILFYGSRGERYAETKLTGAPDPQKQAA